MSETLENQANIEEDFFEEDFLENTPHYISFTDEERKKINKLQENNTVEATTIIKEKAVRTIKKAYVITFTENWYNIVQHVGITAIELKVIFYIVDKMEYGNLISISQSAIANNINIHKSNVSRTFKNLIAKNVLFKDENGNVFMNSNLFSKGLSTKLNKEKYQNLKNAQITNQHIETAF